MTESLDKRYFKWMYRQVASVRLTNPKVTYWSLLNQLHKLEFDWFIHNDDNRVEDGRNLRYEFSNEKRATPEPRWFARKCSVLEMLIGLSRRFAFESNGEARDSFWEMLTNINLDNYNDYYFSNKFTEKLVNEAIQTVINRTYARDGQGGLFPLTQPKEDQRNVELWYQLAFYLLEKE